MTLPTIWFTGLSASGKSTLSESVYSKLISMGVKKIKLLDGEAIRDQIANQSFDEKNREEIGQIKARIAKNFNNEGYIVLISGIAHKSKWRSDIRKALDNYYEIFLNCSPEICAKRDYKGHYERAISGELKNFIGVTEQYEFNDTADLVINTSKYSIEECTDEIMKNILPLIKSNYK